MLTPDPAAVRRAAAVLRRGGLVAFATETVYGLGADAGNDTAVRRIFTVKGRPVGHPLIVHIRDRVALADFAVAIPEAAGRLTEAFWPGPLTIVLRRHPRVSPAASAGLPTVALRVPSHPVARALLDEFGGAIAAPSANRFGSVSPTTALHVRRDLGADVDVVLDGGACAVGVESTIVDLSGEVPRLLRPGGVGVEALEHVLGRRLDTQVQGDVRAPGMLPSHYAPRARVMIARPDEIAAVARQQHALGKRVALLSVSSASVPGPSPIIHIAFPDDADAAAARLYAALREADERGADVVICMLPPEIGLGRAVADRLRKAAGPR